MEAVGGAGWSSGTQPAAGAADAASSAAATAIEADDDEQTAPKKSRKRAIGCDHAICVDREDPMTGKRSQVRISRFELAKSKGLRPSGKNAEHQGNIDASYLLKQLQHEDNVASMSRSRGAPTTDGHVQKVI